MILAIVLLLKSTASELGNDLVSFLAENLYLILGLLVGVVVAIVMRKTFKMKP